MRLSILLLNPPGRRLTALRQAFLAAVQPDGQLAAVASADRLLRQLGQGGDHHLVLVPEGYDSEGGDDRGDLELVAALRKAAPEVPIVVVAEQGNVQRAARAVEAGATDFLVLGEDLPQRITTLLGKLRGLFEVIERNRVLDEHNAQLRKAIESRVQILGRSTPVRRLLEQIRRVAAVHRPVLIVGERGTGKELVARAIHFASGAAERPIVTVNCAAFNDALLESELFGYEKGAFTGADGLRRGRFEQADGGTLFLDEVANMSLAFQDKILRVVEYGVFTRVGGTEELRSSARVIAATNRDLREQIRKGEFHADLYDRLAFETIEVPALRQRKGDIELLARHFLDQFARETPAYAGKTLSAAAVAALNAYPFPGNIRELKNIIERAAYRDSEGQIAPEDLGLPVQDPSDAAGGSFSAKLDTYAQRLIAEAMTQAGHNQAQAARNLGLTYDQFRYYWQKYFGRGKNAGKTAGLSP